MAAVGSAVAVVPAVGTAAASAVCSSAVLCAALAAGAAAALAAIAEPISMPREPRERIGRLAAAAAAAALAAASAQMGGVGEAVADVHTAALLQALSAAALSPALLRETLRESAPAELAKLAAEGVAAAAASVLRFQEAVEEVIGQKSLEQPHLERRVRGGGGGGGGGGATLLWPPRWPCPNQIPKRDRGQLVIGGGVKAPAVPAEGDAEGGAEGDAEGDAPLWPGGGGVKAPPREIGGGVKAPTVPVEIGGGVKAPTVPIAEPPFDAMATEMASPELNREIRPAPNPDEGGGLDPGKSHTSLTTLPHFPPQKNHSSHIPRLDQLSHMTPMLPQLSHMPTLAHVSHAYLF